jgi:hypothetical protein
MNLTLLVIITNIISEGYEEIEKVFFSFIKKNLIMLRNYYRCSSMK